MTQPNPLLLPGDGLVIVSCIPTPVGPYGNAVEPPVAPAVRATIKEQHNRGVALFILPKSVARACLDEGIPFILNASAPVSSPWHVESAMARHLVATAAEAQHLGAQAIAVDVILGGRYELDQIEHLRKTVREADAFGMPVVARMQVVGWNVDSGLKRYTNAESALYAAQVAKHLGADVVQVVASRNSLQAAVRNSAVPLLGALTAGDVGVELPSLFANVLDAGACGAVLGVDTAHPATLATASRQTEMMLGIVNRRVENERQRLALLHSNSDWGEVVVPFPRRLPDCEIAPLPGAHYQQVCRPFHRRHFNRMLLVDLTADTDVFAAGKGVLKLPRACDGLIVGFHQVRMIRGLASRNGIPLILDCHVDKSNQVNALHGVDRAVACGAAGINISVDSHVPHDVWQMLSYKCRGLNPPIALIATFSIPGSLDGSAKRALTKSVTEAARAGVDVIRLQGPPFGMSRALCAMQNRHRSSCNPMRVRSCLATWETLRRLACGGLS